MPGGHRRVMGDVVLLLPGPTLIGPPLAALVAAALAEAHPGLVGHRMASDAERGHVDDVARTLVVVGEVAIAEAHRRRARRYCDPILGAPVLSQHHIARLPILLE